MSNQQDLSVHQPTNKASNVSDFDSDKLLYILSNNIIWILLIISISTIGGVLYLRWTPNIYKASSTIKLEVRDSKSFLQSDYSPFGQAGYTAINMAGEMELLKSDLMYNGVMDAINLHVDYFSVGEIMNTEIYKQSPFFVNVSVLKPISYISNHYIQVIDKSKFYLWDENTDMPNEQNIQYFNRPFTVQNLQLNIKLSSKLLKEELQSSKQVYMFSVSPSNTIKALLKENLKVNVVNQQANTLTISFNAHNREKAIDIVDAFNKTYIEKTVSNKNLVHKRSLEYLNNQLDIIKDSLDKYEKEYKDYTTIEHVAEFEGQGEIVLRIRELEKEKIALSTTLQSYTTLYTVAEADSSSMYLEAIAYVLQDEKLLSLIKEMELIELERERVKRSYTERTTAQIQSETLILQSKAKFNKLVEFQVAAIQDQISTLDREILTLQKTFYKSIGGDPILKKIEKNLSIYEEMSSMITTKIIEINIAKAGTVEDFRIIAPPNAAPTPISPIKVKIIGISIALGIIFSVLLIAIKYILQNQIYNINQINKQTQNPVLGMIPKYEAEPMSVSLLVVHKHPKASISEAFRSIRTNLDFIGINNENKTKVISVTSTISGEGKTFVSVNLAGVIAMSGMKVIIIDADLRKPKVHLAFQGQNIKGISSILIGKTDIDSCTMNTDIPTLKYISAGKVPPNPSELLMSTRFDDLLQELKNSYDVVIVDTPPVGLVTDGILVMQKVDVPLYVFRAEYSRLPFINNFNHINKSNKFNNLNAVLNAVPTQKNYYGYGKYSYGGSYTTGGYAGYGSSGYYEESSSKTKLSFIKKLFKKK